MNQKWCHEHGLKPSQAHKGRRWELAHQFCRTTLRPTLSADFMPALKKTEQLNMNGVPA